jgi:uncharacterized protein GlcG (DUF336 family)
MAWHRAVPVLLAILVPAPALAQAAPDCPVTHDKLAEALRRSVKPSGGPSNGGLDNHMWAAVVRRDGTLCAIAFSGATWGEQWLGSRVIAAQKANTANAFSLKTMAVSSAHLYAGSQPGGFLYGIATGNPPSIEAAYAGEAGQFGTAADPMVGKRPGGVITFAGGLGLYGGGDLVGGLGLSGDTSCADHNVAWRVRQALGLDKVPAGPPGQKTDGIIYDIGITGGSSSGFGHPKCAAKEADVAGEIGAGSGGGLLGR